MNVYTCAGFRSVRADGSRDAADIFATREAVRRYGKRGFCRVLNENGRSIDGKVVEWRAFIGYPTGCGETTGSNIYLTVTQKKGGSR